MKYAQTRRHDIANGPGIRTTLFVSGCSHFCKGCFNREYWDFNYGKEFTKEVQDQLIEEIKKTKHFSLLGGEPFQAGWDILAFLFRVKHETGADIWCWTGYRFEELINPPDGASYRREMLKFIDFLVDGKFDESKKDITLKFRGSSNQRIIDVKESLKNEKVITPAEWN